MTNVAEGIKLLRFKEVIQITGLSKSTIERKVKADQFPRPLALGARAKAWRSDDLDEWIADLKPIAE